MCGCTAVMTEQRLGIPLDEDNLDAMCVEERKFWLDLLEQAQREIKIAQGRWENFPYVPSDSLRKKYRKALTEHNGRVYCQVKQMERVFVF